jgi:hypothetical protein
VHRPATTFEPHEKLNRHWSLQLPRSIQIAVAAEAADAILRHIDQVEGIVGITRQRNASVNPPGDVLSIQTSNDAMQPVFSELQKLGIHTKGIIHTSDLNCLLSPSEESRIESESNEATWDEMASLLRQDTNLDFNFLALMLFSGSVAATGLWADKLHLVIGAMVIAPAFEPLIRIPFGIVADLRPTAMRGLVSSLVGYLMLIIGAGIAVLVLRVVDAGSGATLETRTWVEYWSSFSAPGTFAPVLGGLAGAIVLCGLRPVLTTGVMITLALVPSMAIVGMGLATADFSLAGKGFIRWAADAGLVIGMGSIVFWLKQKFVHRRRAIG